MKQYLILCVILILTFKCDGHRPTLLGGLLTGAHEIGHKVHEAIEGFAHGNVNLNFHGNGNGNPHYHHDHQTPPTGYPNNEGHKPEKPETIIVIVQEDQQQNNYGSYGQRPQPNYGFRPGGNNNNRPDFLNKPEYHGYNANYNLNVQWNADNHRPGYGHPSQGNNNNGNYNTGNANPKPNYGNHNGNNGHNKPNYNENVNPNNYGNPNPNPNYNGNTYTNSYGNIPTQPPFNKPIQNDQNIPTNDVPTKQPGNNSYGTIYDPSKENNDKKHNNEFNGQQNNKDQTTKKPADDDKPLFVPLNPNQYTYGGDKIEINAPKRETSENKKPVEEEVDDEIYPIDVRIGDE